MTSRRAAIAKGVVLLAVAAASGDLLITAAAIFGVIVCAARLAEVKP